jgi:hypothetical protein
MNTVLKSISVIFALLFLTAGSVLMIGPQILIIIPAAFTAGIILAVKRSFWALTCFGYPLTFGLASAYIGWKEMVDYTHTTAFIVSLAIGLVGVALIGTGLWKALPSKQAPAQS